MANLDWSLASLAVDGNDVMCVDPIAAAQTLKRTIYRLTDEEVVIAILRFGLNIRSDAMILRNRLERHELQRHFGADNVPWDPARNEPTEESRFTTSPSSSSRQMSLHRFPIECRSPQANL